MNQTLVDLRNAVNNSEDLQAQVTAGADLVELGAANGFSFTSEELTQGWQELQESDEGLTDFEMEVVAGGRARNGECCWVAREVYGITNPQWLLFRSWLLGDAPTWFRNLYINRGESFAQWLSHNSWLKPAIRTWMDARIANKTR